MVDQSNLYRHCKQIFSLWLEKVSVDYFKNGLGDMSEQIKKATNEYIDENDDLGNIVTEYCDKDPKGFIYHRDLYN